MNTRLQVEHSVTELTCGIDLVALQFFIANSGTLPFSQHEISRKGHAIECRIYAEDPCNNFMPSSGIINHLELPEGAFLRHDHDLYEGKEITPFFDPMISKITTFGQNRLLAARYMYQALDCFIVVGVKNNTDFLKEILISPEFVTGNFSTQILSNKEYLNQIIVNVENKSSSLNSDFSDCEISAIAAALIQKIKKTSSNKIGFSKMHKNLVSERKNFWRDLQWK